MFIKSLCVIIQIFSLIAMSSSWEHDGMSCMLPPDPFGPDGPIPLVEVVPRSSVLPAHVPIDPMPRSSESADHVDKLNKEIMRSSWPQDDHGATESMDDQSMKPFEVLDDNWEVKEGEDVAYCRSCDTWVRTSLIEEHMQGSHKRKIKKRMQQEQKEHEQALQKESLQDKIDEIIKCLEDHPQFLKAQWIEIGHFLKITAIDTYGYSTRSQEFLLTSQTDHEEVIFEALSFLDAD